METGTQFQPVLTDPTTSDPEQVDKVVFVSGKLYYDLQKEKADRGLNDRVALIRVEVSDSKREFISLRPVLIVCVLSYRNSVHSPKIRSRMNLTSIDTLPNLLGAKKNQKMPGLTHSWLLVYLK